MRPSICLCLISYSLWPPPFLSKGTKVLRMTHLDAFICKVVCALYFLSLSLLAYQNEKGWRNWPFSERCQLPQAPLIWVAISSVRRGDPAHMIIMGLASKKQGFRLLLLMPQPPPSATRARDLTWLQKRQEMGKKRYRKENVRKKKNVFFCTLNSLAFFLGHSTETSREGCICAMCRAHDFSERRAKG